MPGSIPSRPTSAANSVESKTEAESSIAAHTIISEGALEPPSHYEYAVLSALVYRSTIERRETSKAFASRAKDSAGYFILEKWQALQKQGWVLFQDTQPGDKTDLVATVYVNPRIRQVVMAFQGCVTDGLQTLLTLKRFKQGIVHGNLIPQRKEMSTFIHITCQALKAAGYSINPTLQPTLQQYQLSFTGHALGAWLAEQAAYECRYPAVTFDSPGTLPALQRWNPHGLSEALDITTYLSKPHLLNTCNEHHPWTRRELVIKAPVRRESERWINQLLAYLHCDLPSIEEMIQAFNPETGMPEEYREIILWPTSNPEWLDNIQSLINNSGSLMKEALLHSLTTGASLLWHLRGRIRSPDTPIEVIVALKEAFVSILYAKGQEIASTEYYVLIDHLWALTKTPLKDYRHYEKARTRLQKVLEQTTLTERLQVEFDLHYHGRYHTKPADKRSLHARHFHPEVFYLLRQIDQKREFLPRRFAHLSSQEQALLEAYECIVDVIGTHSIRMRPSSHLSIDSFRHQITHLLAKEDARRIAGEPNILTMLQSRGTITAPRPIFVVNALRNRHFTGRKAALSALHKGLTSGNRLQCIIGGPGIGKSQLALEFAYQQAHEYELIYWLDANNLLEGYRTLLGELLGERFLPTMHTLPLDKTLKQLTQALAPYTRVLLIIDDIHTDDIHTLLPIGHPSFTQWHVIMTSRNRHYQDITAFSALPLIEQFTKEEAKKFIAIVLPHETPEQALQLATALHYHPLALAQAVGYIEYYRYSIAQYLKLLSEHPAKILEERRPDDRYTNTLYTTLRIAIENIKRESPFALQLLEHMAYLSPEAIAIDTLVLLTKQKEEVVQIALSLLRRQALINDTALPSVITLHPLMQEILYLEKTKEEKAFPPVKPFLGQIIITFADALKGKEDFDSVKLHLPHIRYLIRYLPAINTADTAISLNDLGELSYKYGDFVTAKHYHEQALIIWRKALGAEDPNVAICLNRLGNVAWKHGELTIAKDYLEQALAIRRKTLGHEHPDTASVLNNLGLVFLEQAKLTIAKHYLEQALAIRNKVLGREHLDTATVLNNLGLVSLKQGELTIAKDYLEQALAIRNKALGHAHPDTATVLNNLGLVFLEQGELVRAQEYCTQALTIWQKTLGIEHPDVALVLNNLGEVALKQGHLTTAKHYLERSIVIWRKVLGSEHIDIADSLNILGEVFLKQGELSAAQEYCTQSLAIRLKSLGTEHPDLTYNLHNLGLIALKKGDLITAKSHFEQTLAIRLNSLGIEHPALALTLSALGHIAHLQKQFTLAEQYYQRALTIQRKQYRDKNLTLASTLENLGDNIYRQNNYKKAKEYWKEALVIYNAKAPGHAKCQKLRDKILYCDAWCVPITRTRHFFIGTPTLPEIPECKKVIEAPKIASTTERLRSNL